MHFVCCIKQVPDTAQVKIDPATNTLIRAGVESICNPYDLAAVATAVRLAGQHKAVVTVITMGPPQADVALRECLSLGATQAVLLSDRAFAGADTLATSHTLSQAIVRLSHSPAGPVDLVVCGKQAIDGDTAQVGPGVATRLGFTQLTYVTQVIGVDEPRRTITVRREVEGGTETLEAPLPALLTVELQAAIPRYATLPEMVRSLRQDVPVWGAAELGGELDRYGLKGSPTWVKTIFSPPARSGGTTLEMSPDARTAAAGFLAAFFTANPGLLELPPKGGAPDA